MSKIKVAYIIPTLTLGGAEKQQINILNGLDTNLFEFRLYVLKNNVPLLNQINSAIKVEQFAFNSVLKSYKVVQLIRKLREFSPHIIHSHLYSANLIARFVKLFLPRCAVINHIHGLSAWMQYRHVALEKLTLPLADKIIVVSKQSYTIRMNREEIPENKLKLLYNSFPLSTFSPAFPKIKKGEPIILGMASRLIPLKNIDTCIKLIKQLKLKNNLLHLKIAGHGPDKNRLVQIRNSLGLENDVEFTGFVKNMADFYKSIHVFCITSLTEDLPLTIPEAMACGKPIISAAIGGIPEILSSSNHALLINNSNKNNFNKKETVEKIIGFLDSLDFEKAAKEHSELANQKFSNQIYMKQLTQLYFDIIKKNELIDNR